MHMARLTKKEQEIRKNMAHFGISREEAEELYAYDNDHTNSDEEAKAYLVEELLESESLVDEMFAKVEREKVGPTKAELAKATAVAKDARLARIEYLAEALGANPLFGEAIETSNTGLVFTAPDTNLPISLKVTRHKIQKVVSKEMKQKEKKAMDGSKVLVDWTVQDHRSMALHEAVMARPDLFEAPSLAGTQVGFADRHEKYPFGSIKMTHHKS